MMPAKTATGNRMALNMINNKHQSDDNDDTDDTKYMLSCSLIDDDDTSMTVVGRKRKEDY